ncbi:hypothetical protein IAT38_007258 [Cryptococcus sp. DSM 104549]
MLHADKSFEIVSILQGGIVPRAKEFGLEVREQQMQRDKALAMGLSMDQIREAQDRVKKQRFAEEEIMGKGDRGIQPRNWGEKRVVVQDPFLWQKNCAGAMAKAGLERWQNAVDCTYLNMRSLGSSFDLNHLMTNTNPLPLGTVPSRRRGRGGGSPFGGQSTAGSSRGSSNGRSLWRA